jgi:hypothetical protein
MIRPKKRDSVKSEGDLFSRFYYDQDFLGIWDQWESFIPTSTPDVTEIVFACGAILGKDLQKFENKFPSPLEKFEFYDTLSKQIRAEREYPTQGIFVQPKKIEKILLAAAIGLNFRKTIFVELGTYLGHSVRKITNLFEKTYTVEASQTIYMAATRLFEFTFTPITARLGSSLSLLKQLTVEEGNKSIFFLDAHYSTGITSKEYGVCPLFEELDVILSKFPESICVIDDMRTMNGLGGYPTFEKILEYLPGNLEVVLMHDQMILNLNSQGRSMLIGEL